MITFQEQSIEDVKKELAEQRVYANRLQKEVEALEHKLYEYERNLAELVVAAEEQAKESHREYLESQFSRASSLMCHELHKYIFGEGK